MTKMLAPVGMAAPIKATVMPSSGLPYAARQPAQAAVSPAITANTTIGYVGNQPQATANVPQTGLIGSEQALTQGYGAATGDINQALTGASGALNSGYNTAMSAVGQAQNDAEKALLLGQAGASNYLQNYAGSLDGKSLNLSTGLNKGSVASINQGVAAFDPYTGSGANASKLYNDLTGVNGPEAQAAAQATYQSSPALQYQIDQMQKATERSAAARGGLMSGAALQELQRNAQGLASQDYFKNLGAIGESASRGLTAASNVAGLRESQAQMGASLQNTGLQAQANFETQKEALRSDIATKLADLSDRYGQNLSGIRTGAGVLKSQLATGLGQDLASGITGAGAIKSQLSSGYGQDVAAGRTAAGMAIAQNATEAAGNIANFLNQQGIGVSDMMNKDISSITDMIYQSGMQDKIDMQNLAALIANINGGQATNVMQGQQSIGAAEAAGTLGIGNALQQGIQQYIAATGGKG